MFCIKCGKPAAAGNFCERCFMHGRRLFEPVGSRMDFCRQCGKYSADIEDVIREGMETKNKITKFDAKTRKVGNKILATVRCTGYIKPLKKAVTEEGIVEIIVRNRKCENCIKISGNYHEAIFQVRGERIERVMKKLGKFLPPESIVAINKLKEGYNILVTHKSIAARAVTQLQEYFDITSSYKLVGEKKGKKLYRNFYAVR